jgi:plasmid stability protein
MKTTLELPDALVKQVKLRALHNGQNLKDAVAELLRKGLAAAESDPDEPEPAIGTDKLTRLPVIKCKHGPPPGEELTPKRVAEILLAQEAEWQVAGR